MGEITKGDLEVISELPDLTDVFEQMIDQIQTSDPEMIKEGTAIEIFVKKAVERFTYLSIVRKSRNFVDADKEDVAIIRKAFLIITKLLSFANLPVPETLNFEETKFALYTKVAFDLLIDPELKQLPQEKRLSTIVQRLEEFSTDDNLTDNEKAELMIQSLQLSNRPEAQKLAADFAAQHFENDDEGLVLFQIDALQMMILGRKRQKSKNLEEFCKEYEPILNYTGEYTKGTSPQLSKGQM